MNLDLEVENKCNKIALNSYFDNEKSSKHKINEIFTNRAYGNGSVTDRKSNITIRSRNISTNQSGTLDYLQPNFSLKPLYSKVNNITIKNNRLESHMKSTKNLNSSKSKYKISNVFCR